MADKKLPAKLARPRLFGVVARERLFALLDEQQERPVVWIAGPPGAGKTTLVTTYLARDRVATLWYRIDEGDADVATFFGYLAQAAGALKKGRALRLPALTPEYLLDLPGFARRYFRTLFAAMPAGTALVLDGYEAAAGGMLDNIVNIAVTEVPPGARLLVTSRMAPPAALGHLAAKGALVSIAWDELRLSAAEAAAIAAAGARGQSASIETLHALSDGWAAGFVVLLEHVRRAGTLHQHDPGALNESLFVYFVNEMFNDADEATRVLLMRTALLSGFTAELAAELCPDIQADAILLRLYRQHYFVDRSTGAGPVYRYHALFRDFLLQQGRALMAPAARIALLIRTATLLDSHGRQEDALALFTEAGAWQEAAELACTLAPQWLHQGRYAPLERAISAFPENFVGQIPWLSFWLGMARLPFAPPRARLSLEAAFAQFEAAGDDMGCMQACCAILNSYFMEWNDVHAVDRWGASFQTLFARPGVFPSIEAEIQALASLIVLVFRGSRHGRLLATIFDRAVELIGLTENPVLRMAAVNFAASVAFFTGTWPRLQGLVKEAAALDPAGLPPVLVISLQFVYGAMLGLAGNFAQAFAAIARAQSLAEASGVHILDVLIASHGTYPALNCSDLARVESGIAKMRAALNPARSLDVLHCEYMDCALAMARGDWTLAHRIAVSSVERGVTSGGEMVVAQCRLALAVTLIELGDNAAAQAETNSVLKYSEATGQQAFGHSALMINAYAQFRAGEKSAAHETMRRAFALGREKDYALIFPYAPPKVLQTLCAEALRAGIEATYVRGLIRRLNIPAPDSEPGVWPWPLKIFALGRFEIIKDGAPLQFTGKAQRKPMELLKALIGFGGRDVPIEVLIQTLWPEPREGDGQKAFDVTVHRLRKLLGDEGLLTITDRRASLNPQMVWIDAQVIERILAAVAPAMQNPGPDFAELESAAPLLLELYRGVFLGGEADIAWVLVARDRLAVHFRRFVLRLGEHWERGARWADAARLYERGVELEPLAETLYRRLMECLRRQGQHVEGIEVFRRCRKMLSVVLGVKPAPETEALYRDMVAAARQ